uniref:Uncharacterized protein n=1 Tax=Lepeophtheirus salmonis TaxID=72036 RepID=A0A0K2VBJ8_LEPSM
MAILRLLGIIMECWSRSYYKLKQIGSSYFLDVTLRSGYSHIDTKYIIT